MISLTMTTTKVKCVSFDMEPGFWFIEQLDEIDEDMFYDLWWDEDEVKEMQARAAKVLDGSNKEDLPRGLEHCSLEGVQKRRHERSKASEAVLGEQLRQQALRACEGVQEIDGPELIAREYRKVSTIHQQLAYERAEQDAAEATGSSIRSGLVSAKQWFGSMRRLGSIRNLVPA